MRSGGSYEHFAKGKSGKKEVETRLGIQSINLLKIFIVKCPEPNTTKNPPLQHIGYPVPARITRADCYATQRSWFLRIAIHV